MATLSNLNLPSFASERQPNTPEWFADALSYQAKQNELSNNAL